MLCSQFFFKFLQDILPNFSKNISGSFRKFSKKKFLISQNLHYLFSKLYQKKSLKFTQIAAKFPYLIIPQNIWKLYLRASSVSLKFPFKTTKLKIFLNLCQINIKIFTKSFCNFYVGC